MSNATKCDRCGACYEYGGMTVGEEYDLCDGCVADFEAWMECQPVTGAPERVTESGETLRDTREKLEADVRRKQREWSQSPCALDTNVHEVIGWLDRQAVITEREVKLRELHKFEENHRWHVRSIEEVNQQLNERIKELEDKVRRQAESIGEWELRCESLETERDEAAQRIQTLELEIAKRDKGIERLKRRRGELTEQLGAMADRMAKDGR